MAAWISQASISRQEQVKSSHIDGQRDHLAFFQATAVQPVHDQPLSGFIQHQFGPLHGAAQPHRRYFRAYCPATILSGQLHRVCTEQNIDRRAFVK